jgi:hypothetical protein
MVREPQKNEGAIGRESIFHGLTPIHTTPIIEDRGEKE